MSPPESSKLYWKVSPPQSIEHCPSRALSTHGRAAHKQVFKNKEPLDTSTPTGGKPRTCRGGGCQWGVALSGDSLFLKTRTARTWARRLARWRYTSGALNERPQRMGLAPPSSPNPRGASTPMSAGPEITLGSPGWRNLGGTGT